MVVVAGSVVAVLSVAGSAWVMPLLQRPTLPFGVRVPTRHAGDATIARQVGAFRTRIVASGLIALVVAVILGLAGGDRDSAVTGLVPTVVLLALVTFFYLRARREITRAKAAGAWYRDVPQRVAADTSLRTEPERLPWAWAVPALLLPLVTLGAGIALYPDMPARVPSRTHGSEVVAWQTKSPWVVATPLLIEVVVTLLIVGLLAWSYRSRADLEPSDPQRSAAQHRIFLRRVGRALLVLAAAVNVNFLLAFTAIWRGDVPGPWTTTGMLLVPLLAVAYVLVVAVRTGQGGSRVDTATQPARAGSAARPETPGAARPVRVAEHTDDDRHWRAGILYVNRDDPALMVQKRVGFGWTVNFGNPWGIVIMAGVLVLVAAAALIPALQS
ncbi:hypothetical protein HH310_34225 [Actinoplanes sp. TBRC 11911]|uniref:DUF1648 domain-containing protein n=1 Tax=Actinoplanes sp. TBRC 11911 TaxID=2729386 RepID=UPI00145FAE79|nr:DUF5808 domain-containing protein [Actinoplanes sp. TBRC 11911]NMO56222.1 hypothetical protein [Actinoplanes sp. TBRC 11911]